MFTAWSFFFVSKKSKKIKKLFTNKFFYDNLSIVVFTSAHFEQKG
jgi:hypothetical protein